MKKQGTYRVAILSTYNQLQLYTSLAKPMADYLNFLTKAQLFTETNLKSVHT